MRPQLLPELARRGLKLFKPESEPRHEEALAYCEREAISVEDALKSLKADYKLYPRHSALRAHQAEAVRRLNRIEAKMGGGADIDLLFGVASIIKPRRVLETGVAWGWSTMALLLATHQILGSRVVSVDMPYVNKNLSDLVGEAIPRELRGHWTLIRRADREGIPKALRQLGEIDLAHYDSDKTTEGRLFAYPLIWKHLVAGGVLISDDVSDNDAFIRFSRRLGVTPIFVRLNNKFVGILVKPGTEFH